MEKSALNSECKYTMVSLSAVIYQSTARRKGNDVVVAPDVPLKRFRFCSELGKDQSAVVNNAMRDVFKENSRSSIPVSNRFKNIV
jgi:hypothetical protein